MVNTWYTTDQTVGADLGHTISSAAVASASAAPFQLGTRVRGNNNSEWIFVVASAAVLVGGVVTVRSSGTATLMDTTGARLSRPMAIAQIAFAQGDYGWMATKGRSLTVATTGACAVGARLYAAGTAGRVSTTAASTVAQLTDLRLVTTASGTTASTALGDCTILTVVDAAFNI